MERRQRRFNPFRGRRAASEDPSSLRSRSSLSISPAQPNGTRPSGSSATSLPTGRPAWNQSISQSNLKVRGSMPARHAGEPEGRYVQAGFDQIRSGSHPRICRAGNGHQEDGRSPAWLAPVQKFAQGCSRCFLNPIVGDILDLRAMVKGTRSSFLDQFLRSKSQGFRTKAN